MTQEPWEPIVKTVLLGKDVEPDYYKNRGTSMVDPHLREKTEVCFIPEELNNLISKLIAEAKSEERLKTIKRIQHFLDWAYERNFDQNIMSYQLFLDDMKNEKSSPQSGKGK